MPPLYKTKPWLDEFHFIFMGVTSNLFHLFSVFFFKLKCIIFNPSKHLIFARSFLNMVFLNTQQHYRPYTHLIEISFSLVSICLSRRIPKAFRHFSQPVLILCATSSSISPLLCMVDPR